MKKINIVKENREFNNIISSKVCVKDKNLVIYYKKNNLGHYRFGITVPTKLGKAHIRNYYKRVLRNVCDINKFYYSNDSDYIIIVRKGCLEANYQEINNSFKYLMKKIEKERSYEK